MTNSIALWDKKKSVFEMAVAVNMHIIHSLGTGEIENPAVLYFTQTHTHTHLVLLVNYSLWCMMTMHYVGSVWFYEYRT